MKYKDNTCRGAPSIRTKPPTGVLCVANETLGGDDASQPFYSIIIATYNERQNLPLIVSFTHDVMKEIGVRWEMILADDNSPDGTSDVARALETAFGSDVIRLCFRAGKMGLGSAYRDALSVARGDFIIIMDADLSHHPRHIPSMISLQNQGNLDIVVGSRYASGGKICNWSFMRKFVSCSANWITQRLLQIPATDLTGSFRLYRREALEKLIFAQGIPNGYAFQAHILLKATTLGYSLGEVPIVFIDRIYGQSKLSTKEVVIFAKFIAAILAKQCLVLGMPAPPTEKRSMAVNERAYLHEIVSMPTIVTFLTLSISVLLTLLAMSIELSMCIYSIFQSS